MQNFWKDIRPQAIALAPMEDVTDTVFRRMMLEMMEPESLDVLFTEFVSTDGLCHPKGRERVSHRLHVCEEEKVLLKEKGVKLVAQIWGSNPESFGAAIRECIDADLFDGIDINMGCPVPKIVKQGGCSALINQPSLAQELVLAAKEASPVPVSVKTRTGLKEHDTERWMKDLIKVKPACITLHGRYQSQQSNGQASWDEIAKAAVIVKEHGIPFWGNGDVESVAQGEEYCQSYGVDGVMIGRGVFKNPWVFAPSRVNIPKEEKLAQLLYHSKLFMETWGERKHFLLLRRFYKTYLQGFRGASTMRGDLMVAADYDAVVDFLAKEGL